MAGKPVIVGMGGSPGNSSVTGMLLRACLMKLSERGAATELFDGDGLADLPIYRTDQASDSPVSRELVAAIRRADCVVIGTPGYHGGMSGLVKNALDHLEALRDDARPYLDGRAVGVIVSAGGWQAAGSALVSVRSAIHALRGWPTPFGVTINSAEQVPRADGSLDPRVDGALDVLADQLTEFARWRATPSTG